MRLAPRELVPASARVSPDQLPTKKTRDRPRGTPPAGAPAPEAPRNPAVLQGDKEVRDRLLHGQVGVDRVQVAGHDISHPHPAKGLPQHYLLIARLRRRLPERADEAEPEAA